MKHMKKIAAIASLTLVGALGGAALTGCVGNEGNTENSENSSIEVDSVEEIKKTPGGTEYLEGLKYEQGSGEEDIDNAKAIEAFKKAASKGHTESARRVGEIYFNGAEGVPQDYAQAMEYFKQAADADDPVAIYYLALCYQHALGVDMDKEKGDDLMQRSADLGFEGAKQSIESQKLVDEVNAQMEDQSEDESGQE